MPTALCRLCVSHPAIANSHVEPAFVFRAIKSDSPTGFFRNPNDPNRRVQDGDKFSLLCKECEQRFCNAEAQFATNIFWPFHKTDEDHFTYGPWLHYFITSLAWRTLILDLAGLQSDEANPQASVAELEGAAETMRKYLLGANDLALSLRNHAIAWTEGHTGSAQLAQAGPNVAIRRSAFGFTVLDRGNGYSGILHNLAGFMCFLVVKENPLDEWSGTEVNPLGGKISQPQRVSSWLMGELLGCIAESPPKLRAMSEAQREKIGKAMRKNPTAPALRFREMDKRFGVSE